LAQDPDRFPPPYFCYCLLCSSICLFPCQFLWLYSYHCAVPVLDFRSSSIRFSPAQHRILFLISCPRLQFPTPLLLPPSPHPGPYAPSFQCYLIDRYLVLFFCVPRLWSTPICLPPFFHVPFNARPCSSPFGYLDLLTVTCHPHYKSGT